jgi:CheY-like chemotaxis protein
MEHKFLTILLVDNEAEFCESMSYWLETKHHHVDVCYSGQEALDMIKSKPFDIIFLDIQMPGMDGLAVLREIRTFNQTLPVVIVTGYPKEERMAEAISLGVSGFFPKTSSFEELGRIIKASIRTHKDLPRTS